MRWEVLKVKMSTGVAVAYVRSKNSMFAAKFNRSVGLAAFSETQRDARLGKRSRSLEIAVKVSGVARGGEQGERYIFHGDRGGLSRRIKRDTDPALVSSPKRATRLSDATDGREKRARLADLFS